MSDEGNKYMWDVHDGLRKGYPLSLQKNSQSCFESIDGFGWV